MDRQFLGIHGLGGDSGMIKDQLIDAFKVRASDGGLHRGSRRRTHRDYLMKVDPG